MQSEELEYVGFWPRVGATLIDEILLLIITGPILTLYYGETYWSNESLVMGPLDFLLGWVFPVVFTILFWSIKQATPGKMAIASKIVDAETGKAASTGQLIGRFFGYFLSIIPLGLGFIWVAFDQNKQAWHDKLAGTVVVRKKYREPKPVTFSE